MKNFKYLIVLRIKRSLKLIEKVFYIGKSEAKDIVL